MGDYRAMPMFVALALLLITIFFLKVANAATATDAALTGPETEPSHYCWTDLCQEPIPSNLKRSLEKKYKNKKKNRCRNCPDLQKRPVRREHVDLVMKCQMEPFLVKASFSLLKIGSFGLENLRVVVSYEEVAEYSEEIAKLIELDVNMFELKDVQSGHKYRFCMRITHDHMSKYDESSLCQDLYIVVTKTSCNTCPYTIDTVPMPRVVLVGPTGVGKSTLGNRLLGNKEGICNSWGGYPKKFGVGHGSDSHTNSIDWMVGHWLGDVKNELVTIIDTPGTGDTEGRDCDHALLLVENLKNFGKINTFLLTFKGNNNRFNIFIKEQIKLFETIFGTNFWPNVATEFTFWSHDIKSVGRRWDNMEMNEESKHDDWYEKYETMFNVDQDIPSYFIDPMYDEEDCEIEETNKYELYTTQLWDSMSKRPAYECEHFCKSPTGFYYGQPLLMEETMDQAKRLGSKLTITWKIWIEGCQGKNSQNYEIIHQKMNEQKKMTIYKYKIEEIDDTHLLSHTKIDNEDMDKYFVIRLKIENLIEEDYGNYTLRSKKGDSRGATVKKVVDGKWEPWGEWTKCSKTCIYEGSSGEEGTKSRKRLCKDPENGGVECMGEPSENQKCAGPAIGNSYCSEDCKLTSWASWSSCSEPGGWRWGWDKRHCTRTRSRSVKKIAKHGGICPWNLTEKESCATHKCDRYNYGSPWG